MVATAQQKQGAPAVVGATKISVEEEALKRNTDCVYFLASPLTCKKGSECEYRHSEYARVNPRDCYYWLNGNCLNPKCAFRHPPLDGLLGTQVAAPAGSSMPSSQMATTPAPAAYMSYNQGAPSTSSKQPVPCIFFQKGHCLKGDRCAFMHGPTTNNKAPQPSAAAFATEPHSVKKSFGATETPHSQKLSQNNVSKIVGVSPEDKPTPKVEAVSARSGAGIERTVQRPVGLNEELSQHKGTNITSVSVVNGGFVGLSNRLLQAHSSDEQSFHAGKETDEFLRESSPGFDVLVDDDLRNSDFYHGEDQYGGAGGLEGRNVNEYDIVHSTNYDAMVEVDREMFPGARGSDSFDHLQGRYGRDQQRALSERTSLGLSALERRGYMKADNPDQFEESDLRYRLSKHRTVNGLRSVVSHDHDLENHEDERNYRGSFHRDSHHLSARENSLGSRLWGRIKLPGRSPVNGTEVQSKRDIERGKSWGRLSPGMPQTSSLHGRLRDRIKGRVEGDYNNKEGQNFKGQRIRREIIGEKNADFAGPKSLAELKVGKITENKEQQTLGKRKTIDNYEQNEGDPSFEGPMPLSEILKRKRQYEAASFGSGEACVNKEDMNQKQSNEGLIVSSFDRVVSATMEEVNSTIADGGTAAVAHDESSQVHNVSEHVTEDGLIAANERIEDHELDGDDQMDGDYYDQGEEGDYNYEEVENADPEEEFIEEEGEDGDDFEKKLGVMFS